MNAGEPPHGGDSAPTTGTLRVVPRLPLSLRLIGRSSLPGAALIAAVAAVLVVVLPLAADAIDRGDETDVAATGRVAVSLAEGWTISSQSGGVTTLADGSATLTLRTTTSAAPIDALVQDAVDELAADATATWVVGDPSPFRTDAGDAGETVTAASENLSTQIWVVDLGGVETVSMLTAPIEAWPEAQPAAEQMVESLALEPVRSSGPES